MGESVSKGEGSPHSGARTVLTDVCV
jgi:hypothetical protein